MKVVLSYRNSVGFSDQWYDRVVNESFLRKGLGTWEALKPI